MTKAQHTPGPWTQGSNYEVVAMDGTNICKVHNDEGQGAANARLLSKAPAMLEELRDAAASFREIAELPSTGPGAATSCRLAAIHIEAILSRIGANQ
jgi:hypothetical protein